MSYLDMSEEEIHDHIQKSGVHEMMETIVSLHEEAKELEKQCWEHFYIHQEVFNYLLAKGYIGEIIEGDNWEAAAQNIINGIKNIEGKIS